MIPFIPLWEQYKRIIKPRGAIVLTASEPFKSLLVVSNLAWFRYCWVWDKVAAGNHLNAPYQPLKVHEDAVVFSPAASTYSPHGSMRYFPQMTQGEPYTRSGDGELHAEIYRSPRRRLARANTTGLRYPKSIIRFSNASRVKRLHRTQKPVPFLEYLIRTYTQEGDTVLDNTFGSCSTGEACLNTNRRFIGIEQDLHDFQVGVDRLRAVQARLEAQSQARQLGLNVA